MQDRLDEIFDEEFKIYMKVVGLKIDDETFKIKLPDPANFALYRQAALDADLISSYNNIAAEKTLSRRFIQKRYLGLSDDEIQMNEVMLKEERGITDNGNIPAMQQMYDPAVYDNREAITTENGSSDGGGDSGGGDMGGDLGGGDDTGDTGGGFFGGVGDSAPAPAADDAPAETPAPAAT